MTPRSQDSGLALRYVRTVPPFTTSSFDPDAVASAMHDDLDLAQIDTVLAG
jgi:hypothetical protein